MREYSGKREKPFFSSPLVVILLLAFTLLILYNAFSVYLFGRKIEQERQELLVKIQGREREIRELKEKLGRLESGEGLELEAKSRLNLQKPDENVVIILNNKEAETQKTSSQNISFFRRMMRWFGFDK